MRALRPLPGLSMQLATWNLNSLRVRLPHLLDWLSQQPDSIVGLQELKMADRKIDSVDLHAIIKFHRLMLHLDVIRMSIQFLDRSAPKNLVPNTF